MQQVKQMVKRVLGIQNIEKANPLVNLNTFQSWFCQWNAERLSITLEESTSRYRKSWNSFPAGHSGKGFRSFNDTSYDLFLPFYSDTPDQLFDSYAFYGPMHFLRMLSYEVDNWSGKQTVESGLMSFPQVTILDFGCGLAQRSINLSQNLTHAGQKVKLVLADIPTIRKEFLLWVGRKINVETSFLDCTKDEPLPVLPTCNFCIATEVFEHLVDPMKYLLKMDEALEPGGYLLTGVYDHEEEYMHVSPNLSSLRQELLSRGYEELGPYVLYQKPKNLQ